jgi:hypothetical protein
VFSVSEQRIPGSIRIKNESDRLPLRVEAKAELEDVRFNMTSNVLELPPASEHSLSIRAVDSRGLCFRNVSFSNLDSGMTIGLTKSSCALATNELLRLERGFGVYLAVPVKLNATSNRIDLQAFWARHDGDFHIRGDLDVRTSQVNKLNHSAGPIR